MKIHHIMKTRKFYDLKLIMILLLILTHADIKAVQVINYDFTKKVSGWESRHFRGNAQLRVKNAPEGVIFSSSTNGNIVDTFFCHFPMPDKNKTNAILVKYRYRTANGKMRLTVAVSGGPGAGTPCIKAYVYPAADNKWHDVELKYDISAHQNTPKLKRIFLELIFEGGIETDEYLQISQLSVETVAPPTIEVEAFPRGGQIAAGSGQETITLKCNINRGIHKLQAVLCNAKGNVLAKNFKETSFPGTVKLNFNLSSYPAGNFMVKLYDNSKLLKELPYLKFVAKPDSVTIIDGVPRYHGKTFFALGIYHASDPVVNIVNKTNKELGLPLLSRDKMLGELKKRNFNVVHHSWVPGSLEYHKAAEKYGLMVVNEMARDQSAAHYNEIFAIINCPNVLGWVPYDEPKSNTAKECADLYEKYKKLDPYHPVLCAFDAGAHGLGKRPLADVAFEDYYMISSPQSDLSIIGTFLKGIHKNIQQDDPYSCMGIVIQLFCADGTNSSLQPTIEQVRAQAYTGIIYGAKWILYYAFFTTETTAKGMEYNPKRKYWYLPECRLWSQIGALNAELLKLKDVILCGKTISGFSLTQNVPSRALLWNNDVYLIAVNVHGAKTVDTKIHYPARWRPTQRLFSKAGLPMKKAVKLAPYEVMIIKFKSQN